MESYFFSNSKTFVINLRRTSTVQYVQFNSVETVSTNAVNFYVLHSIRVPGYKVWYIKSTTVAQQFVQFFKPRCFFVFNALSYGAT